MHPCYRGHDPQRRGYPTVVTEAGMVEPSWCKSRRSNSSNSCIEYAVFGDEVAVRDSKDPSGPVLRFPATEWREFVEAVKRGEFSPRPT
jgi:hypothetical protein